ncbi:uncharacterized protein LOC126900105 [Daktulosphaira vitifoliae]|uniref:uncharacterized protein LOC126900105 n=1 Tax=Daktulosphaira vitifoliae TaxID=58002 RepID=UPI0021A994C7|nr:uncharacterized protein LOC126900105 [Daktulosphaira vitifoliae]
MHNYDPNRRVTWVKLTGRQNLISSFVQIYTRTCFKESTITGYIYRRFNLGISISQNEFPKDKGTDVSLILMNDTFSDIDEYPLVISKPLVYGEKLNCEVIGFSPHGTEYKEDVPVFKLDRFDDIYPSIKSIEVTFKKECKMVKEERFGNILCSDKKDVICYNGDDGAALLCKSSQEKEDKDVKNGTMVLYGIAVSEYQFEHPAETCVKFERNSSEFLILHRYYHWIKTLIEDTLDESYPPDNSTSISKKKSINNTTTFITTTTTTDDALVTWPEDGSTEILSEYYDVKEYDSMRKKPSINSITQSIKEYREDMGSSTSDSTTQEILIITNEFNELENGEYKRYNYII